MKATHLIISLFAVLVITALVTANDSVAEPEEEHLNFADMTISEIFEYYKPLYFPGLCLSVSVFFFYKIMRYSFFDEHEGGKKSR